MTNLSAEFLAIINNQSTYNSNNNNNIVNSNTIEDDLTDRDVLELLKEQTSSENSFQIISLFGVIICLFGIIGHLFSIIVLCKKKMKRLSTYSYLLGLSICDEISLILTILIFLENLIPFLKLNLPHDILMRHKILLIYIEPITVSTQALSVWITLAFTIDRYLYCCQPYIGAKYCTRKRASIVIVLLYLLAIIYSIPQFFERTYKIDYVIGVPFFKPEFTSIGQNYYFRSIYQIFFYSAFVVLIPFIIILVLNIFLVYDIIQSNKRHRKMSLAFRTTVTRLQKENNNNPINNNNTKSKSKNFILNLICKKKHNNQNAETDTSLTTTTNNNNNNHFNNNEIEHLNGSNEPCIQPPASSFSSSVKAAKKHSIISNRSIFNITEKTLRNDVTIMLIGLIVVFFICLTPSTILRLITYKGQKIIFEKFYALFLDISNLLVVCNSTLNCIMYVMLGKKFREQFVKAFCPKLYRKRIKNMNSNFLNVQNNTRLNGEHSLI